MDYGANIKAARKAAGLTQKQLADRLGISFVNISQLENNQRTPNMVTLQRLADALGIHIFDLTGIGPEMDKYKVEIAWKDGIQPSDEKRKELEKALSAGPRALYDELGDDKKQEFWTVLMKPLHAQLNEAFERLNEDGQEIAVQRVRELGRIPEYQREQPPAAPQPPSPTSGGKDAPDGKNGAEEPPEGGETG